MIYRKKNLVIFILLLLLLPGCGMFSKKEEKPAPPTPPPAPQEPTRVVLEIEAAGDINPDRQGRPSPLVLRIFQLRSDAAFNSADFFSLYEKDSSVLGSDLIRKEEITLKPNGKQTLFFEPGADTRAVGVFGAFRRYEQATWRASVTVLPNKFYLLHIYVSGTTITIR